MRKIVLFSLILLAQISLAQEVKLSEKIEDIAEKMADINLYKSSNVGYRGIRPEQWKRFVELRKEASDRELITLINYKNPVVKCYAFQALVERNHPKIFDILVAHLNTDEMVKTYRGSRVKDELIGDFFLDMVTQKNPAADSYQLGTYQQQLIDSLLLFDTAIKLVAKSDLLETIKPDETYYERLKEIHETENNPHALIAIAKFQKRKDLDLIINWLESEDAASKYHGLKAVRYFPDDAFFPFLKEIQQQEINNPTSMNYSLMRILYIAAAQYKDQKSRALMEDSLKKAQNPSLKFHAKFIWLAVTKYPNSVFSGLKELTKLSKREMEELGYWLNKSE